MRIVTSGSAYLDVDAYAGCVAYAELLVDLGQEAQAVSTAPWNESISQTVRTWNASLLSKYEPSEDDKFTLIDVSDPKFFDPVAPLALVDEIIDHHPGFEQYWQEKLGSRAQIEFIGAACTLVYERWRDAGLIDEMSVDSAKLLATGILDNTLNFGAKVTTDRDRRAYADLAKRSGLADDWPEKYFNECQQAILENIQSAIRNDAKILTFITLAEPVCFGQLVVWDADEVLDQYGSTIAKTLAALKPDWFMNVISVNEGKSYFLCEGSELQQWLEGLLGITFEGNIAAADRMWMRKEVIKAALSA